MFVMDMRRLAFRFEFARLAVFIAVCEAGSISAAARRIGVAQPALSASIRRLEEDFGRALLERRPRGVVPTDAGNILLRGAYEIVGLARSTEASVQAIGAQPHGEVSIGLPPSAAAVLTLPLLTRLSQRLPGVAVRFVEALSGYLQDWVDAGELDLALAFDLPGSARIVSKPVLRENLMLIGRSDLAQALPSPFPLRDLPNLPLITSSGRHGIRRMLDEYLATLGLAPRVRYEIDAGHQLVRMVVSGEGYGFFAMSAFAEALALEQVRAVATEPTFSREVCVIRHRERAHDELVSLVQVELEQLMQTLVAEGHWRATVLQGDADPGRATVFGATAG